MSTADGGSNENQQSGNYVGNCFVAKTSFKGNRIESRTGVNGTLTLNSKTTTTNKATFEKNVCIKGNLDIDGVINTGAVTKITNADLPYVITQPGCYALGESLVFNPTLSPNAPPAQTAVQSAITIQASNVTLDLGCQSLCQVVPTDPSTQVPFCVGIYVPNAEPGNPDPEATPRESVYICGEKAKIKDFSMFGIRVKGHLRDLRIEGVTVRDCGHLASKALRPTVYGEPYLPHTQEIIGGGPSFVVGGILIGENTFAHGAAAEWFSPLTDGLNNRIKSVKLQNVSCLNNFLMGAGMMSVDGLSVDGCHFDDTWSDDGGDTNTQTYGTIIPVGLSLSLGDFMTGAHTQIPRSVQACNTNSKITNSTVNRTSLKGDCTLGFNFGQFICISVWEEASINSTWENCEMCGARSTYAFLYNNPALNYYAIAAGSDNLSFTNCHFDDVEAVGTTVAATIEFTRNLRFTNCTFNHIQSRLDKMKPAPRFRDLEAGFEITQIVLILLQNEDVVIDGMTMSGNSVRDPVDSSRNFMAGIIIQDYLFNPLRAKNYILRNCVISNSKGLNGAGPVGILYLPTFEHIFPGEAPATILYENCIAADFESIPFTPSDNVWDNTVEYPANSIVQFDGDHYIALNNLVNITNVANGDVTDIADGDSGLVFVKVSDGDGSNPEVSTVEVVGVEPSDLGGKYFTLSSPTTDYYVWFNLNPGLGGSTDPAPSGTGVQIDISDFALAGVDDLNSIAAKIAAALSAVSSGSEFTATLVTNLGLTPTDGAPWSLASQIDESAAVGFADLGFRFDEGDGSILYKNCKAMRIKGKPLVTVKGLYGERDLYSSGFTNAGPAFGRNNSVFEDCSAIDNVYGFLLRDGENNVFRNCTADNNRNTSGVGAGFVDLGLNSLAIPPALYSDSTTYEIGDLVNDPVAASFLALTGGPSPDIFILVGLMLSDGTISAGADVTGPGVAPGTKIGAQLFTFETEWGRTGGYLLTIPNFFGGPTPLSSSERKNFKSIASGNLDNKPSDSSSEWVEVGTLDCLGQSKNLFKNNCTFGNGDRSTHSGKNGNYHAVVRQQVATVALNDGGVGYTNGDVLTLDVASGDATVAVTGEAAGVITSVSLTAPGTFYFVADAIPVTGGSGTGATIDITSITTSYPPMLQSQPSTSTFTVSDPPTYFDGLHNKSNIV